MPRKKPVAPVAAAAGAKPLEVGIVVSADSLGDLHFAPLVRGSRTSVYFTKLMDAVNANGAIAVPKANADYLLSQYRKFATKASLRLLFAERGDTLLIKPMAATEEEKRLMLMLRTPRTLNEIESWKVQQRVEIAVVPTLNRLRDSGLVSTTTDGKWGCTATGREQVKPDKKVAA